MEHNDLTALVAQLIELTQSQQQRLETMGKTMALAEAKMGNARVYLRKMEREHEEQKMELKRQVPNQRPAGGPPRPGSHGRSSVVGHARGDSPAELGAGEGDGGA